MGGQSSSTTVKIPKEVRERGSTITNAAMASQFDPANKYQSFTPNNTNWNAYQSVGQQTTGQLNDYNSANGLAGQNYNASGTSFQPYYNQASSGLTSANANNQATGVNGPDYSYANLQKFLNPYQQGVIDIGTRQIGENLGYQMLQNQDAAAKAGAFGGARHGVIDSSSQKTAAQTMSDFIAQQLNTGYNNAQNQYNTDFSQGLQANQENNAAKAQNFAQANSLAQVLANLGTQTAQNQINTGNAQLNLGNIITAQDEAQKQNAYNKGYLDQRGYPLDVYERLAGINAMQPVNRTSTTTSGGGWLGPALGAFGSVMGAV